MLKSLPLTPELKHGDSFRGEYRIRWRMNPKDPLGELLAVQCDCGAWWGWLSSARVAFGLADTLDANGCAECM